MPRRPGSDSGLRPPTAAPPVLLAREHPRETLRRHMSSGAVERLSRGVYVQTTPGATRRDRALAAIVGAHHRLESEHSVSHVSAAVLHGLPLWRVDPRVHVYQRSARSGRADPSIVRHVPLPPASDRTTVAGVPATTLARTSWDCLATLPPADALVVADAALRAGIQRDALDAFHRPGARGAARASTILRYADAGSESPPESVCRYHLLRAGLPVPTTQVEVVTRLGTFWGDLGWPEWRLVLEYDGRVKYAADGMGALVAEKRRHDALVEAGWAAVRVTKEDLTQPNDLISRLRPHLPPELRHALRRRRQLVW